MIPPDDSTHPSPWLNALRDMSTSEGQQRHRKSARTLHDCSRTNTTMAYGNFAWTENPNVSNSHQYRAFRVEQVVENHAKLAKLLNS